MKDTRNVRCAKCGSENVYVQGDAVWNNKNQQWQFYPNNHNPNCDYEASCGSDTCKDDLISYAESVPMKKYRVIASMTQFLECEIEAENMEDAWKIAKEETDGSEFSKLDEDAYGDWSIHEVYEVEEEANE